MTFRPKYPNITNSYEYYAQKLKESETECATKRIGILMYPGWHKKALAKLLGAEKSSVCDWVDKSETYHPPLHYAEMISRLARERAVMLNDAADRLDAETKARVKAKASKPPCTSHLGLKRVGMQPVDFVRVEF